MGLLDDFPDGVIGEFKGKEKPSRTRSQIGKSNKKKGKTYELEIVYLLCEQTGLSFYRNPSSGAFIGAKNRRRVAEITGGQLVSVLGDIIPPDDELKYKLILECKFYKSFPFPKLNKGEVPAKLKEWLEQVQFDAQTYLIGKRGKQHLAFLCIKINNKGNWIVFNEDYLKSTTNKINISTDKIEFSLEPLEDLKALGYGNKWIFTDLKSFFKFNDWIFEQSPNLNS